MQEVDDHKVKEEPFAAEETNWRIEASDDDSYEPSPEEIIELYDTLEAEGVLELEWQCPGRRPPSPAQNEFLQEEEEDLELKPEEKSDFDFKDEMSAPSFTPRRVEGGPKGSAKKKTTSLDGILSNMRRHRQMEEMEKQASSAGLPDGEQHPLSENIGE
ncbi:PAXIP1-associated glutamate-rich protein 1 [Bacillus rossius redtenbacheri]|uniref:PAXIP1-associated glutamate-rich protein 1 n=1 Tax=Bacillus rossius redtenbacheri TaxID=93214 RepID=UPI002FDCEA42